MRVREVMTRAVECIGPDATLQEAAAKMKSLDVGPLPVCDNDRLVGMVTDRDITVRATAGCCDPGGTHVQDVMTADLVTVSPDDDSEEALERMSVEQVRRLPVVEGDRLVGLVAMGKLAQKVGPSREVGEAEHAITRGA